MRILALNHVSLLVSDLKQSLDFYQGVLGLSLLPRPELGFAGAWLDLGQGQAIHLLCLPQARLGELPVHVGRDQHVALTVADTAAVKQALLSAGIAFTVSQSGRDSVFCRDPDANGIELLAG